MTNNQGLTSVFIACDHRGFVLKNRFIDWLRENSFTPVDLGTDSTLRCDSLDYAVKMAKALQEQPDGRGVLICGSGNGMAMVANRFSVVRAALVTDVTTARYSRLHNDANVLALGADITGEAVALECLAVFLSTECLGGRYAERRERMMNISGAHAE